MLSVDNKKGKTHKSIVSHESKLIKKKEEEKRNHAGFMIVHILWNNDNITRIFFAIS